MKDRVEYLDNLRIFLTILTVAFHTIRGYAVWWWYAVPVPETSPFLTPYLSVFLGFGMNMFFVISGYFTPTSYDKKGFKQFNILRVKRLLVPLVIFASIMPFVMYSQFIKLNLYVPMGFSDYFIQYYLGFSERPMDWPNPIWPDFNYGHLWFLEYLLIFGVVYSVIRKLNVKSNLKKESESLHEEKPFPKLYMIIIFIILLSLITFVIRIWFRMSEWTTFLLFQITFAHTPHYVAFFVIGIIAYRNKWLNNIPEQIGRINIVVAISAIICISIVNGYISLANPIFQTGGTLASYLYSLWEWILAVSMIISLPFLFRKYFNVQNQFLKKITDNTYMIYIFHVPVLTALQMLFIPILLHPILLALIVTILTLLICLSLSILVRKIPYAKKYF
jgi:glucan biosynthesis protein C